MVKDGDKGIACGVVQTKDLGLGHMLMGDPTAEIRGTKVRNNNIKLNLAEKLLVLILGYGNEVW